MASGIAHDIRNPINFVSLALEYLSEKRPEGQKEKLKARELFADAHSELLRVNDMVQGLLDFGKVQTLDLQVENASEVLTESRDEVIRRHHTDKLHLSLEGTSCAFPILVDHGLLLRALVNLFENALEAGGPKSRVRAGVSRKKDDAVLWLEDSGPGIEAENLSKIFTPYFTTKKAGVGLGLTLTRKWVDDMGGRIQVCNVPAGGARFELSFPIAANGLHHKKEKKRASGPRV
jgi:signal transduction histidine kinase